MKLKTDEKYVKRRTIAEVIIAQATLIAYIAFFVCGIIM